MKKPTSVEAYIDSTPKNVQERLVKIRSMIKQTIPEAEEKISYGMPYFDYFGRLVYFAAFKHHIGVYISPPVIEEHAKELKEYKTAMATLQLPHDKPLPLALVKKLVIARAKKNIASSKK